jgi:hypothetical protein
MVHLVLILFGLVAASSTMLRVGSNVLVITAAVAAFITQLAMVLMQLLLVLLYLAQWVSRFWGSRTEFCLGKGGLGGDRSAREQCHRHTHLYDMSVFHDRSLSWDRDLLLDVLPILVPIAIAFWFAVVCDRVW